jgi:uncharacterized protein involved in response to NO
MASGQSETEKLSLSKAAEFLLEECRMVLPGIQALFGFQLIVVFNPEFNTRLGPRQQELHLLAIGLIAVAIIVIMAPAAYNRQMSPTEVTEEFIRISTRLLLLSMLPLSLAICIDFYLIAGLIAHTGAGALTIGLFAVFVVLWIALPRARTLQSLLSGR